MEEKYNLVEHYTNKMATDMAIVQDFLEYLLIGDPVPSKYHYTSNFGNAYYRKADKRYKNWKEAQKWWDNFVNDFVSESRTQYEQKGNL
ncbi:MAG TPA: hypothetical protein PKC05_03270 [Candidatus Saccharibacteria bacterium]|nr:hypothetical protein [Candidatus Saccharibacteria bacterium]